LRTFWIFLHLLGAVLWIGGGAAAMVVSLSGRTYERAHQGVVARLIAAIYTRLIAPGAALAVVSGLFLTMTYMGAANRGEMDGNVSPWIMAMQGLGIVGAGIIFAVALPAASKSARLDPVTQAAPFDALRTRSKVAGMAAGTCAFVSLIASILAR
jgi:hypothetical protein